MAITFTIDNDPVLIGFQDLTLDESIGVQTGDDDDVDVTQEAGVFTGGLDQAFIDYLNGLGLSLTQVGYAASVDGASSSDSFITVNVDAGETVEDLFFSVKDGSGGLIPDMQTLADEPLYLIVDSSGDFATLNTAADGSGRTVAAFYLDDAADHLSAQVQMVTFEPIQHPNAADPDDTLDFTDVLQVSVAASLSFDFDNLDSGNFLWVAIGDESAGILITGDDLNVNSDAGSNKFGSLINGGSDSSDTMNTSQGGQGATIGVNSQHFTAGGTQQNPADGSIANVTLVTGFVPLPTAQQADGTNEQATGTTIQPVDYEGYINTTGAGVFISQLTGTNADMRISLYEAGGGTAPEEGFFYLESDGINGGETNVGDDTALSDDTPVAVGTVTVTRGTDTFEFSGAGGSQAGMTVVISGSSFTITGAIALDTISWTSAGGDTFNRFSVQALATTDAFDIGRIDIRQGVSTDFALGDHLFLDDDGPTVTLDRIGGVFATVDESDLLTNASVPGASLLTPVITSGADGAGTAVYSLDVLGTGLTALTTTAGQPITLVEVNATTVQGQYGAGLVAFEVTINAANGSVTLDQRVALAHPNAANPDDAVFLGAGLLNAVLTVTDGDGDSASDPADIGPALEFKDDGPTVTLDRIGGVFATVDETDLLTNASVPGASLLTPVITSGADGAGTAVYSLDVLGTGLTALTTTAGQPITLVEVNATTVQGQYGAGLVAFEVTINAANGSVTLDQRVALDHPLNPNPDDSLFLGAGLLNAVLTVTDGDGDSASDPADIGPALEFKDDGPTVTLDRIGGVFATVDETDLLTNASVPGASLLTPVITSGADGAGTAVYSLDVLGTGLTALTTTALQPITLVEINATTVQGQYGAGLIAFEVTINAANGSVTLDQRVALAHPNAANPDDAVFLGAGLLNAVLTVTDGDGDSASDPADIGPALEFRDDGPFVTADAVNVIVDDDGGAGGNDGGTNDDNEDRVTTGSITTLFEPGADGLDSYTLSIENFDVSNPPPVLRSQGSLVSYNQTANLLTGYVESGQTADYQSDQDRNVFTFELNVGGVAGAFEFTLIDQIDHPDTTEEDNLELAIGILLEAIDNDGDTSTSAAPVQLTIVADDDSPVVTTANTTANDATGSNDTITTDGATGNFAFAIGFDDRVGTTYSATNSDLRVSLDSGLVFTTPAGSAITAMTTAWASEDANQATFTFTFEYQSDPSSSATTPNSGTIVFDKSGPGAGTYTFTLDDPISSFGIISTATADGFVGYLPDTATIDTSQPFVTVAALADNFFVQFTGRYEASGGTDGNNTLPKNNNLDALAPGEAWAPGATATTGDDDMFSLDELFTQTSNWVSISGTAAGVAGDTMQAGEVLDFNFYQTNPEGDLTPPDAVATTSTMFIEFDALDNGEDLVLVLKLVDKDDPTITTTRAVVVQFDDIFHIAQAGEVPASFLQLGAIDQNDGMVIIESNDYNILADDNWTIAGAQVVASTEGLRSNTSIIDLVRATGDDGDSSFYTSDPFSAVKDSGNNTGGTWDGDVFKIVNIGFLTEITPDSQFNFNVEVIDFDGDASAVQSLTIDVLGGDALAGLAAPAVAFASEAAYLDSMRNVSDFDMAIAFSQATHLA